MNPLTLSPAWLIAVAVLVLGAAGWITVDTLRLNTAKAQVANLTTQVGAAKDANDSALFTIAAQATSLKAWSDAASAQVEAAQAAAAALKVTEAARVKTAAALTVLEAKDKALPACTKLLAVDLKTVCPSHAQALAERSK